MADVKIASLAENTSPTDTNIMIIEDNSDTKKITFANIKATLKAYFDNIYATIANLNLKAPLANPTFTGVVTVSQIKFPATQVPSSDPNTLDDYEKGTFLPVVVGDDTEGVATYTYQEGRYEKIGNTVHFMVNVAILAHTGTGNIVIKGLPFVHASSVWVGTPCNIISAILTYSNQLTCLINSTSLIPMTISSGGGETRVPMDTSCYLAISGTYQTT